MFMIRQQTPSLMKMIRIDYHCATLPHILIGDINQATISCIEIL